MNYFTAAKELNMNIEILEETYRKNNIRVIKTGCKPYSESIGSLYVYVELGALNGDTIPHDIVLKLNIYDKDDDIFMMEESEIIKAGCFSGYDTLVIRFSTDQALNEGKRGKLYAVRRETAKDDMCW